MKKLINLLFETRIGIIILNQLCFYFFYSCTNIDKTIIFIGAVICADIAMLNKK